MEASALQAPAGLARSRLSIGYPLLRLRSDEQLVAFFRGGNEEAFRVIHDRYHQRLFAYARQMLPGSRQDAEDALQDIFVRAYSGLRASDRKLALRAWLYRVAHNRCIDEMRRPPPPSGEIMEIIRPPSHDPIAVAERRESLRRLIDDVRRLPDQQRSALLMRELGGMPYADLAAALGVSVPAVKSLLVRARIGLAHAMEARDVACYEIREELVGAHDRGVRPSGIARRHMHDCVGCKEFRGQIRGTSRGLAALMPLGPLALLGKVFGIGSGGAAGSGAGGAAAAGGAAGTTGAVATIGAVATGAATHVATLIAAAAVVTAGGAVEIQHTISSAHAVAHHAVYETASGAAPAAAGASTGGSNASAATPTPSAPSVTSATSARALSSASSATSDSTAGPLIPSADQLNPADAAASAASGTTGAGTTGAGTTGAGTTGAGTTGAGTTGAGTTGAGTTGAGTTGAGTTGTAGGGTGAGTPTTGTGTTGTGGTTGPGTGTTGGDPTGTEKGTPGTGTTTTGSGTGTPPTFGPKGAHGTGSTGAPFIASAFTARARHRSRRHHRA